ncbi:hypothetical protein GGX14DRAFT_406945 [Mycena pura]|uniref:Uncharacterized protein n=1 Tax=Mycena pura TaxID=153505 RepID=A0AAD6US57_9AGAR|nr:hypothetical protein GGX14DRAFT_406945 [Mycena pura]
MTHETSSLPSANPQEEKRRRHAAAQRRYRLKRTSAGHERQGKAPHGPRALSEEETRQAREHRRSVDADYRERVRQQKFIDKFGRRAFNKFYIPLLESSGPHLPGKQFIPEEVHEATQRRMLKSRRRRRIGEVPLNATLECVEHVESTETV